MVDRSLTPIILYSTRGLSHPSYYNETKMTNKKEKQKGLRRRKKNIYITTTNIKTEEANVTKRSPPKKVSFS